MKPRRRKNGVAEDVARTLRHAVLKGTYGRGSYLPTLRQVADSAGVAYLTAARAAKMLEREGLVAAEPRKGYRVLDAGAKAGTTHALFGFLSSSPPDAAVIANETHKALLSGFQCVASRQGLGILAMRAGERPPQELARSIQQAALAGVAVDSDRVEIISPLQELGIPVVLVDAFTYEVAVNGVVQDNFRGGFLAGQYLARKGHREVAWLGLRSDTIHSQERLGGAIVGLQSGGARIADGFDIRVDERGSSQPSGEMLEAARVLLTARNRPRAILALWQNCANALLAIADQQHLQPGRDFALVSWGIEENRQELYAQRFGQGRVPPMVCWSAASMAEMALNQLVFQTRIAHQQATRICVPMRLWEP